MFSTWLPRAEVPGGRFIYSDLLGDRPLSSVEGMSDLQAEASARAWRDAGPPWLDITVWAHLSVALLYISYLSAAEHARQAGNLDEAQSHDARAAAVWSTVDRGNTVAMSYLQKEAGYARFSDYRDFAGRDKYELGTWEDAHDWVTGTSVKLLDRDTGNPRLHAHNLVLNLVQAQPSGKWGRLDIRGLYRIQHTAAMYGRVEIERLLSRELGLVWTRRPDGNGREIGGISQDLMDLFSSRSLQCQAQPDASNLLSAKAQRWCCTSVQENLCGNTSLLGTGRPFPSIPTCRPQLLARKSLGR